MDAQDKLISLFGVFFLVLLVFVAVLAVPFIQIWAVNTLFKTNIEYTLVNWLAVFVLNSTVKIATHQTNSKK